MIDIKKAEEEFKKYTSKYDLKEPNILMKLKHTFRVEEICEKIAISLGLDEEKIKLAKLIGLLHDIARFEQYTQYKTYVDIKSIDHGDFGVELLEKDNYIRKYIETDKYDEIIKTAIHNHNKYSIEKNLDEESKLFCKIIRDADKLDIMYLATFELWNEAKENIEKQIISSKVLEQFTNNEIVNREYVKNDIDRVVVNIAFIYDYNFKENYQIIKENDYINKIIDRFNFENKETVTQMNLVKKLANDYINKNIQ